MRVQQVPNSPYFIHYDDEVFCCISKSRESQEPISESEMQAFLGAVANGLLYSREDAEKACIEAIEHARAVNNNTADKQYKIEERHWKAAKRI